jgi:hypothetical protein
VESLDSTVGIVAAAAGVLAVLALLTAVGLAFRLRRLRAAQRLVLAEHGERDLVGHAAATQRRVDQLSVDIEGISAALEARIEEAERRLDGSVSKTAVLRYDAFNESTGRQSSSVALLDDDGNGVVVSAILQREQARVYAKPIAGGTSELELSPEEREAMRIAWEGRER